MDHLSLSRDYYKKFIHNINSFLPEGITEVDIELLHQMGLLNQQLTEEASLTRYFHVFEEEDHMTLINNQFVVWIIPQAFNANVGTLVLIAINEAEGPKLELGYFVSNLYNTSRLVLRVLDKYLSEIQETEDLLRRL